jgi:quercetin dioxygenase-like cupin family protein
MDIKNVMDLEYMEFPTGRKTRVMVGSNGYVKGKYFCQGFVEIFPDGSIPLHTHETVETYTIIEGNGLMTIGGETKPIAKGDFIYIDSNIDHALKNTGMSTMYMMFVYAPNIVVSHWAEEKKEKEPGKLS